MPNKKKRLFVIFLIYFKYQKVLCYEDGIALFIVHLGLFGFLVISTKGKFYFQNGIGISSFLKLTYVTY